MLDAATFARQAQPTPPGLRPDTTPKTRLPWVILLEAGGLLPARSAATLARLGLGVRTLRSLDEFEAWLEGSELDEVRPGDLLVGVSVDAGSPGEAATELLRGCSWDAHVLWFSDSPSAELGRRARRLGATLTTLPDSATHLARAALALLS